MCTVRFLVLPVCSRDVILGWDFLSHDHTAIDCPRAEVAVSALCASYPKPASNKLYVADGIDIKPNGVAFVNVSCADSF